jgi:hypothetical protein
VIPREGVESLKMNVELLKRNASREVIPREGVERVGTYY